MSSLPTDPDNNSGAPDANAAADPASAASGTPKGDSQTAKQYVAAELQRAKTGLRTLQIVGSLVIIGVGGYLLSVTSHFSEQLKPENAAEIAEGMINQQIEDKGPDVIKQIKEKVPEYIAQTPDYALKELPKYRESAEDRIETQMTRYCKETSDQLGTHLDTFLDEHKDQVKELLQSANDPEVVKEVGDDLKKELLSYLKEKPASGESLSTQIDTALASLKEVQKKMHHLAVGKHLNRQERQTRRAIAILSTSIDHHGMIAELPLGGEKQ